MANPSSPSLLTPSNESLVYGNVLVFVFVVPTDTDNQSLVFRVELDTVNPPSSSNPNYKVNESRLALNKKTNGHWQVKNGVGTFIDMPTAGVDSSFYGRDARVTIRKQDTSNYPNSLNNWFWRISASDNVSCSLFNRAVFGQNMFCSG
jgi:hypothetical protein